MDPQHLCINAATGDLTTTNVSSAFPSLTGLLGTLLNLRVTFEQDNVSIQLPSGTTGRLTAKLPGRESGPAVLMASSWTASGVGSTSSYAFELVADSQALRDALGDQPAIALTAQIEWQVPSESPTPRKSLPFPITIRNSPSRPGDTAPDPAADAAWAWIKARLVAGSNVTFTINEATKTIAINSAGSSGNQTVAWSNVTSKPTSFPSAWNEVSGKPSTFPPSTHYHSWAQILYGSPADNAALVSYLQSNGAGGQPFDMLVHLQTGYATTSFESYYSGSPLVFPRDAIITDLSLAIRNATPRWNDAYFEANVVVYGTDAPASASWGALYAQSFWYYEYFPNTDPKGLGIPLLVNGSVSMSAGSRLDISFNTGFPGSYGDMANYEGLWLRVRGRYTN